MKIYKELYYTDNHEWLSLEGDNAYFGITDFAQQELGDIVFVELPEEGEKFEQNDAFSVIESVKAASDIYAPVSCTILEANAELEESAELINQDAFENWIVFVKITDKSELNTLMNAREYEEFCSEEE